jgi:hypothetical protein
MKLCKAVRYAQPSKSVHCNVRCGSWLCENAKTLNRDRRSYSSRTVLVAQRATEFNLEIELKNIILCRVSVFEFLHSQGQKAKYSLGADVSPLSLKAGVADRLLKHNSLGIVLFEPFVRSVRVRKYFEVIDIADLFVGIDINPDCFHRSLASFRRPQ